MLFCFWILCVRKASFCWNRNGELVVHRSVIIQNPVSADCGEECSVVVYDFGISVECKKWSRIYEVKLEAFPLRRNVVLRCNCLELKGWQSRLLHKVRSQCTGKMSSSFTIRTPLLRRKWGIGFWCTGLDSRCTGHLQYQHYWTHDAFWFCGYASLAFFKQDWVASCIWL